MDADAVTATPGVPLPLEWVTPVGERLAGGRVRYRGPLVDTHRPLRLHLGVDGWSRQLGDVAMERDDDGTWLADIPDLEDCVLLDAAVGTADDEWDNNGGADYRLWLHVDPVDAHVHVRADSSDSMGLDSLRMAMASGGMVHGLVSWQDNRIVDRLTARLPWLTPLVWVGPKGPGPEEVATRLADGAVGLKLHPSYDHYPADSPSLDPFLAVADQAGVPVAVHTAPGPSDPDLVRRLAERFPEVDFLLYHTFLGPPEGRRRAARHAQQLPNLHLETSWCGSAEVRRLIDEVGEDRVLFGSDAAVDGAQHFVRTPPNIELSENYNQALLALARQLPEQTFRALLQDNTRRLFRLGGEPGRPTARALDRRMLLGRWELVSWEAVDDEGQVTRPFGERPRGLIICLADGWAAAQIAASDRPERVGDPVSAPDEDRARAYGSYLAYAGPYEIRGDSVVIRAQVSLYPEFLGAEQVRQVEFRDGDLVLRTPRVALGGQAAVHELRWRRAGKGPAS